MGFHSKPSFQKAIQQCINMDENEFRLLSRKAKEYGISRSNDDKILEANRNLFLYAVENFKKRDNFSNIS